MADVAALEARLKALEATLTAHAVKLDAHRKSFKAKSVDYEEALDTIWMLLATTLVFFMHAGFSLLEAGSVRQKNTQNILAKNLMVVCAGFICWWCTGYAFGFGVPAQPGQFMGTVGFFMDGIWANKTKLRFWLFQGAFCATSATIVSGSMAERVQIKGFLAFTAIITLFIYPAVVYWGWSGYGFLNYKDSSNNSVSAFGPALIDFAGSGLVHMTGGCAALCGSVIVGARKDRYDPDHADEFVGHNIPFCVLGTFCLWVGWYGFNPGSTGTLHDVATAHMAGLSAVNTTLAPCMSGLLVFFLRAQVVAPRRLDVSGFCNGILAGLVAITAGCATVTPGESMVIGLIGGFAYQITSMAMVALKVDDVVDAFAVHGVNGLWGILAVGFFGDPDDGNGGNGSFYGGDQFSVQAGGALCVIVWTVLPCCAIFASLKRFGMLRLSDAFQDAGADFMEHSPCKAYGTDSGTSAPMNACSPHEDNQDALAPKEPDGEKFALSQLGAPECSAVGSWSVTSKDTHDDSKQFLGEGAAEEMQIEPEACVASCMPDQRNTWSTDVRETCK
eukprot:TRINITY_DN7232_c1_g5_i1.p1 TRINITY_DN7232_c1_g5~~TRINITY_DN7232_c1_g5_i1.p1  ORF type:complete len:559 (-),score=77.48 TRINITY_DN7232_c1_g5_i1:161-1837(-)